MKVGGGGELETERNDTWSGVQARPFSFYGCIAGNISHGLESEKINRSKLEAAQLQSQVQYSTVQYSTKA